MHHKKHNDILQQIIVDNINRRELDNVFLAHKLCVSEAQFYRIVKQEFDCSPNKLVRNIRLDKAYNMLKNADATTSVKEVAFSVGFTHVGYFIRRFQERFGESPGSLLKQSGVS